MVGGRIGSHFHRWLRLKDQGFFPRIRGQPQASGFQIPSQPIRGASVVDEEQQGSSLLGFMGAVSAVAAAGYWGWKLLNAQQDSEAAPSNNERRTVMNPKNLRFTQLDIAPDFSDGSHPPVKEAITLIGKGELSPSKFGELTVHRDKYDGGVWCEDNRRLYVLRKAGVLSVPVKIIGNDYMSRRIEEGDKLRLKDPAFLPRIRGQPQASGVQITSQQGFIGAVAAAAAQRGGTR